MMGTLAEELRAIPGFVEWQRAQTAETDRADAHRLALILGAYVERPQLPEAVGAVMAAGFHR